MGALQAPYLKTKAARARGCAVARQTRQETVMPKSLKMLGITGLIVLAAACARQEEEVVVMEPEPISSEPGYTGKLK